jgi:hypothetical protein
MTAASLRSVCDSQIERGHRNFVEQLEERALAKIASGAGEIAPVGEGSLNGQQFSREIRLDCTQVAEIARAALDAADGDPSGGSTGITFIDFNQALR